MLTLNISGSRSRNIDRASERDLEQLGNKSDRLPFSNMLRAFLPLTALVGVMTAWSSGSSFASGFSVPTVIPLGVEITVDDSDEPFNYRKPKTAFQVRYVELLDKETLSIVTEKTKGGGSTQARFLVDLNDSLGQPADTRSSKLSFALYAGWEDELLEDRDCPKDWDDFYRTLLEGHRNLKQGYVSAEDYVGGGDCARLLALNDSAEERSPAPPEVRFNATTNLLSISSNQGSSQFKVPPDFDFADQGIGALARRIDQSQAVEVVAVELRNNFWKVLSIGPDNEIGELLGPDVANPNQGFIPRSLSVAPGEDLRFGVIAPRAESSLWEISVFESRDKRSRAELIAKVGSDGIAYSEHRGFDHAVSWTGPESLLFLYRDGLSIHHVEVATSRPKTIGKLTLSEGQKFSISGEVRGYRWTQDLTLFRLEAISALPLASNQKIRIAAVGIFNFKTPDNVGQVALPLLLDVPWNLGAQ